MKHILGKSDKNNSFFKILLHYWKITISQLVSKKFSKLLMVQYYMCENKSEKKGERMKTRKSKVLISSQFINFWCYLSYENQ